MIPNLNFKPTILFLATMLLCSFQSSAQGTDDEEEDIIGIETLSKIRLGYLSHTNFYRQILLGFQNENATDGIDPGYDAINTFDLPNDMYFYCNNTELFIQGVGYFNESNSYPIGIQSNSEGAIIIQLEATENFDSNQTFYLHDSATNTCFNLKSGSYTTTVGVGTFNDRFSLRFLSQAVLGTDNPTLNNGVKVSYINNQKALSIANTLSDTAVSDVKIFNLAGQQVSVWNVANENQSNIIIPINGISQGIYIANVTTSQGTIAKKFSIK